MAVEILTISVTVDELGRLTLRCLFEYLDYGFRMGSYTCPGLTIAMSWFVGAIYSSDIEWKLSTSTRCVFNSDFVRNATRRFITQHLRSSSINLIAVEGCALVKTC